jgi:hypothetical protein
MIANRPTHVRAPINPYNPKPTSAQLQSRAKYQEAVDAVATLNSRETRAHLQQQTDRQRFDSSINVFADSSNSNWKSVPVAPPKQSFDLNSGRRSVDPVVVDLGFERPPSSNHDGVDLHTFHHDTKQRHNSLMCTINELDTINKKFVRKSPRPIKSDKEAHKMRDKAHKAPLDKRIEALEHACENCFNEEMKMKAHHGEGSHDDAHGEDDEHIVEHCKWLHRRAVHHTMQMFIGAVATMNQNGPDKQDNARMVDMLKHQNELGELYCTAIVVRNCPGTTTNMGMTRRTTIPQRGQRVLEVSHEIHRILVSAPGSAKMLKLRDICRVFVKDLLEFRDVFNAWDKEQVIEFSRLSRSIGQTGLMPFTRAPTAAEIKAAQEHQESLHEHEKNAILRAYEKRKTKNNSDNHNTNPHKRYHEGDDDDVSSVSSSGSSSGSESIGTEESRERLMDEIQRAKHDTPFIAGGKVMYAPRRPHTRGSRALTGMEMDVIPLVTGARDSVEHATSLSSPRRKPHPSWTPHVKLTAHPTFGNKYHGHHLHVHHNNHGHEWKEKNKKFDDRHDEHGKIIHKHHHHRHSQGHHGHHGHKKRHPKTLRECLLSHETDISVLVQAYKTEQLKFPPSWKEAADKAEKEAQQVEILRDNTPVAKPKEQHNVYEIEAHGKPPPTHRVLQELVDTARTSMSNQTLRKFKAGSYKKVLALSIHQGTVNKNKQQVMLDNACEKETVEHGLYIQGLNTQAARTKLLKYLYDQKQKERLIPGRRPANSAFSKAVRIPGRADIDLARKKRKQHGQFVDGHREKHLNKVEAEQKHEKDSIDLDDKNRDDERKIPNGPSTSTTTVNLARRPPRPASTQPTAMGTWKQSSALKQSSGSLSARGPKRPDRPQSSRAASTPRGRNSTQRNVFAKSNGRSKTTVVLKQRQFDMSAKDIMKSVRSSSTWNKKMNNRWLHNGRNTPHDFGHRSQRSAARRGGGGCRPATSMGVVRPNVPRPESRVEALHVENELNNFEARMSTKKKSRVVQNMFRLKSQASKQARNAKMRKMMHAFG